MRVQDELLVIGFKAQRKKKGKKKKKKKRRKRKKMLGLDPSEEG